MLVLAGFVLLVAFGAIWIQLVYELILEDDFVEYWTLFGQEFVHFHFHLAELLHFGKQFWFLGCFYHRDQQLDVLRELVVPEVEVQVNQQVLVHQQGNLEHHGADIGGLVAWALREDALAFLLEVINILNQHWIDRVVIVINEHFAKLDGVQVIAILDNGDAFNDKSLPLIATGSVSKL
jgi:hypothetical protein